MKLLCSHGGRFFHPCGPDGAGEARYVGGETRVLVVPRAVSFRDLAARLAEMVARGGAGSASLPAEQARAISIRHRLADDVGLEDILVTVTCDEEVAHMRDEYDRLRATRPAARFRVFVTATATASSSAGPRRATTTKAGLPPLAPPPSSSMRRVQSEQAVAAREQHRLTRRVRSAEELAEESTTTPIATSTAAAVAPAGAVTATRPRRHRRRLRVRRSPTCPRR